MADKALDYINRLKSENEQLKRNYDELYSIKRQLEDELIERGFAECVHGDFRLLSDEEKDKICKETAKEVLQKLLKNRMQRRKDLAKNPYDNKYETQGAKVENESEISTIIQLAKEYGVEVGE